MHHWKHNSNIFSFETESPDPDSPRKNEKAKKFWSFVKSLKNDMFGINTLRENGILKTDMNYRGVVLCNARRRRRIRTGSNPTSVMKKGMNYISSMAVKTSVASITEGIHIIHGKLKKNIH